MKNRFCPQLFLFLLAAALNQATAQTTVVAGSVNGVLNPTQFTGSDIGAQINTAWRSGKTVRVPANTTPYAFTTTINHPGTGYLLECDAGAILQYQGSGDAIILQTQPVGNDPTQDAGIEGHGGCEIKGNSNAESGIHILPSSHTFIRNIRIYNFTNSGTGYGILDSGGNTVTIDNVSIQGNKTGVFLTGINQSNVDYAANAVHIVNSDISNNLSWGIDSQPGPCNCTRNIGNTFQNDVFESNNRSGGAGDVRLNWDQGANIQSNYFEGGGTSVRLGDGQNVFSTSIERNSFINAIPESIQVIYGIGFNILYNNLYYPSSSSPSCFVNITPGSSGNAVGFNGVGANFIPSGENEFCRQGNRTTTP